MQVSSAFVVIMGMGVTFVGLTCIIFLTMLMGKILSKPEAPKPAAAAAPPAATWIRTALRRPAFLRPLRSTPPRLPTA